VKREPGELLEILPKVIERAVPAASPFKLG